MRTFAILVAAVLISIGAGVGTLAGGGSTTTGTSSATSASIVAAARPPCWTGPIRLVASPTSVHPGEVIALDTTGSNPQLLEGGNITTFEADTPSGWRVVDYLGSPGGTATGYGIVPFSPHALFAGVGTSGLVKVRIPDVQPGTYRLVRFNSANPAMGNLLGGRFPIHGVNLCATVTVLTTPPALPGRRCRGIDVSADRQHGG
jgi:hypothetical protein